MRNVQDGGRPWFLKEDLTEDFDRAAEDKTGLKA
jgi:hypothetical protein